MISAIELTLFTIGYLSLLALTVFQLKIGYVWDRQWNIWARRDQDPATYWFSITVQVVFLIISGYALVRYGYLG